jgi:hypothetical protein
MRFCAVSLTVRFADFETKTRDNTLREPAADSATLEHRASQLFLPFLDKPDNPQKKRVRLIGARGKVINTWLAE